MGDGRPPSRCRAFRERCFFVVLRSVYFLAAVDVFGVFFWRWTFFFGCVRFYCFKGGRYLIWWFDMDGELCVTATNLRYSGWTNDQHQLRYEDQALYLIGAKRIWCIHNRFASDALCQANPSLAVQRGDKILKVNGLHGNPQLMFGPRIQRVKVEDLGLWSRRTTPRVAIKRCQNK